MEKKPEETGEKKKKTISTYVSFKSCDVNTIAEEFVKEALRNICPCRSRKGRTTTVYLYLGICDLHSFSFITSDLISTAYNIKSA